jgi:putative transcriptional regulator
MTSLQGRFLVASPHLCDPNFFRSVVLIVQHGDDGAFGLLLNRPLEQTVQDIWELRGETLCDCEARLYVGGPVEAPLVALHNSRAHSDEEVLAGVHLTTRPDSLDVLVRNPPDQFRVFTGYSGWGSGQLDDEVEVGGWLKADASPTDVFADPDAIWSRLTRRINLDIVAGSLDARFLPDDASLN